MRRKIPNLAAKMVEIIEGLGFEADARRARTIYTVCPKCKKDDKFSILKDNGACVCYRGSCNFKGWFTDWVMEMGNLTRQQATDKIYGPKNIEVDKGVELQFLDDEADEKETGIAEQVLPIVWPLDHIVDISDPKATEGVKYLESRGIPDYIAKEYGISYSTEWRRVVFPISSNGVMFGYQARAIDDVQKAFRMRNNSGPWRYSMLAFQDRLVGSDHAIVTEGPIDAIKFHTCGGNVASCGKIVSDKQLDVIVQSGVKKIYLALDPDAMLEMRALAKKVEVPVYIIKVPKETEERCVKIGKKADFGECTYQEAAKAFNESEEISNTLMVFLK